jgi:hypothetical protein
MLRRIARESKIGRLLAGVQRRLGSIFRGSRLFAPVLWLRRRRKTGADADGETAQTDRDGIRANSTVLRALRQSRLARGVSDGGATVRSAGQTSVVSRLSGASRRFVRGSWLYRWLTAEPDPDVVVIDLRETLTVGPWLAALERGIRWLLPAVASSALIGLGRRCHHLAKSRPVQLASLAVGGVAAALLLATAVSGTASVIFVTSLALVTLLAVVGSRIDWTWADLTQTRGFRALAAAFEPPEPPETAFESETAENAESETPAEASDDEQEGPEQSPDRTGGE